MTQLAVFEASGVAVSYISNVENALVNPSLEVMVSLAKAVQSSLLELLTETD